MNAPLPWSLRVALPQSTCCTACELLDASGKVIAFFKDFRDAEYILSLFATIEQLKKELDE